MRSALIFSPSAGRADVEDGLLQAYEVARLRLNTPIVVLSACETALGLEVAGEGLAGLTQAFLQAGAGSVATSLWKVDDEATSVLMLHFHKRLRAGDSPPVALQHAQMELLSLPQFVHPYFWAGFILVGRGL